jgi:hypothetical protein
MIPGRRAGSTAGQAEPGRARRALWHAAAGRIAGRGGGLNPPPPRTPPPTPDLPLPGTEFKHWQAAVTHWQLKSKSLPGLALPCQCRS